MSKYNWQINLNPESTTSKIMHHINDGSNILEFGCAEGRMTRYLRDEKNCKVFIIEIDHTAFDVAIQFAEDGICSDIDTGEWENYYSGKKFDYIIFADVLEHLRNPEGTLSAAKAP